MTTNQRGSSSTATPKQMGSSHSDCSQLQRFGQETELACEGGICPVIDLLAWLFVLSRQARPLALWSPRAALVARTCIASTPRSALRPRHVSTCVGQRVETGGAVTLTVQPQRLLLQEVAQALHLRSLRLSRPPVEGQDGFSRKRLAYRSV